MLPRNIFFKDSRVAVRVLKNLPPPLLSPNIQYVAFLTHALLFSDTRSCWPTPTLHKHSITYHIAKRVHEIVAANR